MTKTTEIIRSLLDDPFQNLGLTDRERQVARLAALDGKTYKEIAETLGIAEATARTHLQNVVTKLDVPKAELIKLFVERLEFVLVEEEKSGR